MTTIFKTRQGNIGFFKYPAMCKCGLIWQKVQRIQYNCLPEAPHSKHLKTGSTSVVIVRANLKDNLEKKPYVSKT